MNIFDKIMIGDATLSDQESALALKDPEVAYWFALEIEGADIEMCQEIACRDPYYAVCFAHLTGADIEKCQEAACKDPGWAYCFARDIPEANLVMSLKACKGTIYENKINQLLMEKALL